MDQRTKLALRTWLEAMNKDNRGAWKKHAAASARHRRVAAERAECLPNGDRKQITQVILDWIEQLREAFCQNHDLAADAVLVGFSEGSAIVALPRRESDDPNSEPS